MVALGSLAAASCGGRAVAARSAPGDPPLAAVEPAGSGAASTTIAAASGGSVAVTDASNALAGARIDLPPGALSGDAAVTLEAGGDGMLAMFPGLTIVRGASTAALTKPARVRIPYSAAFLAQWNITDKSELVLYTQDADGLWGALVATPDPAGGALDAQVDRLTSWVVAPGWMLTSWQRRAIFGDTFEAGQRNVLLIHGWNSSPWDGCQLQLSAALHATYDHVAAYSYPSALDIGENAAWLRDAIAARYPGVTFDVVGVSEGGLVARAAVEGGAWNDGRTIAQSVRNLITIATPHLGVLPETGPSLLSDLASSEMRADSRFLTSLNARPDSGPVRYTAIAGDGWRDGTSDGLVGVDSALGRGVLPRARAVTLPLVHAPSLGGDAMPCDAQVYKTIASVAR
jgi:hypothetical protein